MSCHADLVDSGAERRHVYSIAPASTMPLSVLEELGRIRRDRFSSALQVLRTFLDEQTATTTIVTTTPHPSMAFDAPDGAAVALGSTLLLSSSDHRVAAALTDVQTTLDYITMKAGALSEVVKAAVTSAVLTTLLGDHRGDALLRRLLSTSVEEVKDGAATATGTHPAYAIELMARTVDALSWVVDAVCSPLVHDLTTNSTLTAHAVLTSQRKALWFELAARAGSLLRLAHAGLASTATGGCQWGAPVHSGVLRLLDALVQTCVVLRSHIANSSEASENAKADARLLDSAAQLGDVLMCDDIIQCVAAQLQMPVQVLEEMDGFTRKVHTFAYDVLRHGVLTAVGDPSAQSAPAGDEALSGVSVVAQTPWTVLDSTRRPQSPLELYTCAVSFLSHAAGYRNMFPTSSDGVMSSVGIDAWRAYVSVLERALQEGEAALAIPISTSSSSSSSPPPPPPPLPQATQEVTAAAMTPYLSPLVPYIDCYTDTRDHLLALPPTEDALADSEPATPCDSPMANAAAPKPIESHSGACRETEDSLRSNDVTVAGMTDAETSSLCGESAGLASLARSRPIAITSSKANGATTNTTAINITAALATTSVCVSPTHSSAARRATTSGGSAGIPGVAMSLPQQHPLCKSAMSPTNSAFPPPSSTAADGAARLLRRNDSSKSSCVQRERVAVRTTTTAATAFVRPAPVLRLLFPSHAVLTRRVLASLALLTTPRTCAVASMTALVDANVLAVMSALLEYPGSTLQEVVLSTLENCFTFWENMASQSPDTLLGLQRRASEGALPHTENGDAAVLPTPLRACLHTFSAFLGWDGEGWAVQHAVYMQRALRLLINVLDYLKATTTITTTTTGAAVASAAGSHLTPRNSAQRAASPRLLADAVHCLLCRGVIAHVWRCLSTDATQAPEAVGASSGATATSSATAGAAAAGGRAGQSSRRATTLIFEPASMYSYGCFLYGAPAPVSCALLSPAQCTAMQLLYTLAKSLDWSAARVADGAPSASVAATTAAAEPARTPAVPPRRPGGGRPVPAAATYWCFMEESFKHLPACANCLRRCTYTRSQSRPIVAADHEALSRVLNVLRILFGAMGAGVVGAGSRSDGGGSGGRAGRGDDDEGSAAWPAAAERRQTWTQQIADSQVLDVLVHIGTAAELVSFELPRLCIFTLRSYLDHVHVLARNPFLRAETTALAPLSRGPRNAFPAATSPTAAPASAEAVAAKAARAWAGLAALQALVVDPPPQPTTAGVSTWGCGALRESLLVVLLARMQRRCAGQSATASVPQRLEVLALLIDVLARLVDTLPTSLTDVSADDCVALFDASAAVEVTRVAQRVVAAVVDCRVWSGTAQELRYIDPNNTTPVKETLRFLCRVTQLVNGSLRGLLCVLTSTQAGAGATAASVDAASLGKGTAAVLLAESVSVTFAFHVVTMDFPLALAALVNGTRWQTRGKASGQQATGGNNRTSSSSAASALPKKAAAQRSTAAAVVVTVKPPSPPLVPQRKYELSVFDDEDRRETCEVAASTLVELLCVLRRVEALLCCPTPPSPAALAAALSYRPNSTIHSATHGGMSSSGGNTGSEASIGMGGVRAILNGSAAAAASAATTVESQWAQIEQQHQLDVVVVQNSAAGFAGVVTSRLYPQAVAALAQSTRSPPGHASVSSAIAAAGGGVAATANADSVAPTTPSTSDGASPTSLTYSAPTSEQETDDPRNWRQTEEQWRRRMPLLRTSCKDALHALDLDTLDEYLAQRQRHLKLSDPIANHPTTCCDGESTAAGRAVTILAAEKKRYLESI
ncbi:hypothetical protein NQL31_006687 [Lotmaria passim]